jgi:flavin-dependent dehydrogenase
MKYDLIVVGGGPAGLMAAKTAAEDDLKVLLIERKKNITEINRPCGQFTNISMINVGGKVKYGYTEPLNLDVGTNNTVVHFPRPGFSIDYNGPIRPYYNYICFSPSGHKVYREKDKFFGFYWEKEILLKGLLASCRKARVEVKSETIAMSVEDNQDCVKVFVRDKGGENTYEAKRLIAADGSSSTIAEGLGMNSNRKVLNAPSQGKRVGRRYYVLEGVETEYRLNSWIILTLPKPGRCNFYMVTGDRNVLGGAVEETMKMPFYERWFHRARIVRKMGMGAFPIRTPMWEPAIGNVLVIGDASVTVETSNPGAIAGGYMAAKATIMELKGEPGYPEYTAWFINAYDSNQPEYLKAAGRNFALNTLCSNEEVDYLFQIVEDQVGVVSTLVGKPENMKQIKADRPALYSKLAQIGLSDDIDKVKIELTDTLGKY